MEINAMLLTSAPHSNPLAEPRRRVAVSLLAALLLFAPGHPAGAAEPEPSDEPLVAGPSPDAPAAGPEDALQRGVPRSTVRGYLSAARKGDYEKARQFLDLRHVPEDSRATDGLLLARQLKVVLDRTLWIDLEALSDQPEGQVDDGLPPSRDRVGTLRAEEGAVDILVDRVRRDDGVPIWKISSATLARVPDLYDEFGYGPLGELLPAPFFEWQLLEIQLWQWIGLVALVLLAFAISWRLAWGALRLLRSLVERTVTALDDRIVEGMAGPLRLLLALGLFTLGTPLLGLAVPVARVVQGIEKAFFVLAVTWVGFRAVDVFTQAVAERLAARGQAAGAAALPMGRRTVKVVLAGFAVIVLLHNLGFNVTALLAGLGVGGLAVALAAQKSIENLFGGMTVIADQPVRVGDFCRFGDQVGTVEDIGLRSTRVRTLDRTVVTIPNAEFSQMKLENFAKRDRMRIFAMLGLRYETTPDQLRYVLIEIRKLLYAHPKITPDPARVRFVGFGAYSLDLELFAYVATSDWNEFLAVREDLFLRIIDIVDASGTGFAFPSQTTYLEQGTGMNAEKTRAAEGQVRAWKEQGELCLPYFPQEKIAGLDDTLDYPPRGSAWREGA